MIELHPQAVADAAEAAAWYAERSPTAARAFAREFDHAIAEIIANPLASAEHLYGTRRYIMRRFPYRVVYRIVQDDIQIVAVSHARRRPGFWRNRLS